MKLISNLSVKSKLICMLLFVCLISIGVTGAQGYLNGRQALQVRIYDHLTSLRAARSRQIEAYFDRIGNDLRSLAENVRRHEAMGEFADAFDAIQDEDVSEQMRTRVDAFYEQSFFPALKASEDPDVDMYRPRRSSGQYLQYHYLSANPNRVGDKHNLNDASDGSAYSDLHLEYHPLFRDFIERYDYYDLFLINPDGDIVYSVAKETDYGTNLVSGPYRGSSLAKVFEETRHKRESNAIVIVDFAPYGPSFMGPAGFMATPIFKDAQLVGVLAIQLPIVEINRIMTDSRHWQSDGLGETGEVYLVGPDFLMRSASRFMIEQPADFLGDLRSRNQSAEMVDRIDRNGTTVLSQEVRTEATTAALVHGQSGTDVMEDYRGEHVLTAYAPLEIKGLDWAIIAGMDRDEAYAPIERFERIIATTALGILVLSTLLAMLLAWAFLRPIRRLIDGARRVAEGDLDVHVDVGSGDELDELATSFNQMVVNLKERTGEAEERSREAHRLLASILPTSVADRLKAGDGAVADSFPDVTVVFANLKGVDELSGQIEAKALVQTYDEIVEALDEAAERQGIERIRSFGSCYMAVCGVPTPFLDHSQRAVEFANHAVQIVRRYARDHKVPLVMHAALHAGPVVAGIVGRKKFVYDVWGESVTNAFRMLDDCPDGQNAIVVSDLVRERVADAYRFEAISNAERTCWLLGEEAKVVEQG